MNKIMRKLLSTLLLLVVVLQLQALPTTTFIVNTAEGVAITYGILTGTDKRLDASVNEVGVFGEINSPTTDVIIPSTVTYGGVTYTVSRLLNIGHSQLKSLTLPPTIHILENSSFQLVKLKEFHIPATITELDKLALFQLEAEEIWLPSTGLKKIGKAFTLYCYGVKRIHGLAQSQVEYIGSYSFLNWFLSSMTSDYLNDLAVLPSNIREVGDYAFTGNNSHTGLPLDEVVIPASLERLGDYVYNIAHNVYIKGDNPFTLGTDAFGTQSTLKIHVPVDRSFAFKAASDWSSYTDKIVEELKIGATGYTTYYLENENFQVPTVCTAYIITGSTPSGSISTPDQADVKAFGAGKIIPKQTGFVLQGPANSTVVYQANVTGTEENVTGNLLVGTATEHEFSATGKKFYVLANGDQGMGFYKQGTRGGASIKLPAHRAGLRLDESIARSKEALFFDFDAARENSQTTGIENISNAKQPQENVVYDLQGRRVTNPTHGIYIINGKKVIK